MNQSVKIPAICILLISSILCLTSCKDKPTPPVVITNNVTDITQTSAVSGGNITDDGGAEVTTRGICWGNTQNPTTASGKTNDGTGNGSFTSNISGLTTNIKYYVHAYATNSAGTAYGNEVSFTTNPDGNGIIFNPNLTYGTITDIEGNEYKTIQIGTQTWMAENLKTTEYNDGSSIPLVTDNTAWYNLTTPGYCWYDNEAANKEVYGALYNWYTVNRGNLCPAGWHVPTDAEWTILTTYLGGESIAGGKLKETGTTHWNPNTDATNETGFTALPGGIRGNGGVFFHVSWEGYWWSATEYLHRLLYGDICNVSSLIDRNTSGFSVRCVKGEPEPVVLPTVTTMAPSNVTTTGANSGGVVKSNAGASITSRGVCWSTSANPTTADSKTSDGTGAGPFSSIIEGLAINTVYYLRAYATNSAGTAYGDQLILKTMTGTVTDIDGNIYYTVTIGSQEWMSENLKVTRYRNGDQIPNVTDDDTWNNLTTGAYCWNANDSSTYKATYGALYNWYAVSTGNLCSTGWHVPTHAEWTVLTDYLGGIIVAGGKLKEVGTTHWISPNDGATNESGFTALPGGSRGLYGFDTARDWGFWWSASEYDATDAWHRILFTYNATVNPPENNKANGFSVRCIKD